MRKLGSSEDTDLSPLYAARVFWYRTDKGPWVFFVVVGLIVALFGLLLTAVFAHQDDRRNRARAIAPVVLMSEHRRQQQPEERDNQADDHKEHPWPLVGPVPKDARGVERAQVRVLRRP